MYTTYFIKYSWLQEPTEDGSNDVKKTGQSVVATINKAIEVTTKELLPKLTKEAVTDLVLVSMWFLPKTMPSNFQETFTPIAAAGGAAQVNHLARLLATQMTNAGIGPGVDYVKKVTTFYICSYICEFTSVFAFLWCGSLLIFLAF